MWFEKFFKKQELHTNQKTRSCEGEICAPKREGAPPPVMFFQEKHIVRTGYMAFFKNGILYNVTPRNTAVPLYENRQIAYSAQYIVLDGEKYDLEDSNSILRIPIPRYNRPNGMPETTFDLSYILKMRVGVENRPTLLVPLAYKTANLMLASPICWQKRDYYTLIVQLWRTGEFAYGDYLLNALVDRVPHIMSEQAEQLCRKTRFLEQRQNAINLKLDYIIATSNECPCSKCSIYGERVYSISGKDKRIPKLSKIGDAESYCCLRFWPFNFYEGATISKYTFDSEGRPLKKDYDALSCSKRAYVDNRNAIEKAKYLEQQARIAELRQQEDSYFDRTTWVKKYNDYFEYYQVLTLLKEKAPKSFSGYMRMKKGNTVNFQKLVVLAKEYNLIISP